MVFAEVDPISGWAQVILQTGALGLLAIIIYYFPPWMSRLLDSQAQREQRILDATAAERGALMTAFKEEQRLDRLANAESKRETIRAIEQQTVEFKQALTTFCRFNPPDQRSK